MTIHRRIGARLARAGLAGLCALSLAACALPRVTQRPAQTEYRLLPPSVRQDAAGLRPVVLRVGAIGAAPGLGGVAMLYSAQPLQLMPYRDSRWVAPPADMIASALRQALARQPWVAAVQGDAMSGRVDGALDCHLDALEHDVYSGKVRLALSCQLLDVRTGDPFAAWDFDASRGIGRQDARDYAQAAQDLLGRAVSMALSHTASALRVEQQAAAARGAAPQAAR